MGISIEAHQLPGVISSKASKDLRSKRVLDTFLILLALPILIPLASLIALVIRSVSTGPVLFRQERVGYMGRRFMCFKFRTMYVDADTTAHQGHLNRLINSNTPMMKMDSKGDPRIIPFGLFLRASGLDELPQLINVLRGEMSLVGPRPCLPYEYEKYLPWQKERFATVPGLTGLWQVSGKNKTTFVEMIQMDIRYAKYKTLGWDLKIILTTIPVLIMQMIETRRSRRSNRPNLARPKANYSNRAIEQYSLKKVPLIGAVHAADGHGEDVWIRKETKLNL
jgi:exopolysaccharide production protein ExoY